MVVEVKVFAGGLDLVLAGLFTVIDEVFFLNVGLFTHNFLRNRFKFSKRVLTFDRLFLIGSNKIAHIRFKILRTFFR